jgi:hypothetical protein
MTHRTQTHASGGADQRVEILDLTLDRIRTGVSAFTASAPVVREHREVIAER